MNPFTAIPANGYAIFIWLAYLALSIWITASRHATDIATNPQKLRTEHALLGILLLAHAPLAFAPVVTTPAFFGAREALILLTWLAALIYWTAAYLIRLDGLQTILLPVATITIGIGLLLPQGHATPWLARPLMQVHFAIAMLSYGFFAVAAGLATLMRLADRALHQPGRSLLQQLPPLLALERLLFSTLSLGLALLTATLTTGAIFSEELFGRALSFNHKTIFSVAAWLVFATLLWGRQARGWRGRTAINWTLAGFSLLLLAYIGSRFVLDGLINS